uniref:RING finger protein 11 n=2 Tax=Toxocara canis TaxID=6265 RepID=A0A183VGE8_TOXCA
LLGVQQMLDNRTKMGNCLPMLFPSLRHLDDQSQLDDINQGGSSENRQGLQSSYVNELWAQENSRTAASDTGDTSEQAGKARLSGMLEQIPADKYSSGTKGDAECAICMMEFLDGDAIRYLPCMHCYHVRCVDDWLMRSFKCPSCLEPVDSAILSSFTAHTTTDLLSLSCSPATSGPAQKSS